MTITKTIRRGGGGGGGHIWAMAGCNNEKNTATTNLGYNNEKNVTSSTSITR
jgi:hypothetical protein